MCRLIEFQSMKCGDKPSFLVPCSSTTPCASPTTPTEIETISEIRVHPGECPKCLRGNVWPTSSYTTIDKDSLFEAISPENVESYAQSLLDFLVLVLIQAYKAHNPDGKGIKVPPHLGKMHNTRLLQTYHDEMRCNTHRSHDQNQPVVFGQRCTECDGVPGTDTSPAIPGVAGSANTARQFRRDVAAILFASEPAATNPNGRFATEIGDILARGTPHHPPHYPLLQHVWPYDPQEIEVRFEVANASIEGCVRQLRRAHDAFHTFPSEKSQAYSQSSRQMLKTAAWIAAYDTGLDDRFLPSVISHLAGMLEFPDESSPLYYQWLTQRPYRLLSQRLDFAHLRLVLTSFSGDAEGRVAAAMCEHVKTRLAEVRERHLAEMNGPRRESLLRVRLDRYVMYVASRASVPDTWVCPVCREGRKVALNGCPVKLLRCGHVYHVECMVGCMLGMSDNNTACPYCRATVDGLEYSSALSGAEDEKAVWVYDLDDEVIVEEGVGHLDWDGDELPDYEDTV